MKDCETILQVIRLRKANFTYDEIRGATGCGNSTVHDLNEKFKNMPYSLEELEAMDPSRVIKLFYSYTKPREDKPLPDYEKVYSEITGSGKTELECYEEYAAEHPDGYKPTQFKKYFREWRAAHHLEADLRMAVNRKPGETEYIDWLCQFLHNQSYACQRVMRSELN